jgi:tetratricopeptide (TPR) repeat protein
LATLIEGPFEEMQRHLHAGRWHDVVKHYEHELDANERQDAEHQLGYAIALINAGRPANGFNLLSSDVLALPNARILLRRFVIPDLLEAGTLNRAAIILEKIVAIHQDAIEELRLLGSVLARLGRTDESLELARKVLVLDENDFIGHSTYLLRLLKAGRLSEAGEHARSLGDQLLANSRLTAIGLLALTRSGKLNHAAWLALSVDLNGVGDAQVAAAVVRTLAEVGCTSEAIEAGEKLLDRGWDEPTLRSYLAQAYMSSAVPDRYEKVVEHVEAGIALAPSDALMHYALGEALLRLRRYSDALAPLAKAVELQPKVPQARALYARALKQAGRYAEAAREFRVLLKLQPSSAQWQRYAAGALAQAGRREEASALFDEFVSRRAADLPDTFEKGLGQLWDRVDEVDIPRPRLDWAWSLRNSDESVDRAAWERAAKWGHLADHYLLDWLECRSERVQEPMMRLAELDEVDQAFREIDRSKGLILASAHVGAMYAGPLALELLGIPCRWLASTPSVARTSYGKSLISTSDQDDMQVAKAFMQSLRQGYAVVVAVDGAINLGAPRIHFEGQEITYSSFAARTAHRLGVPSVFVAPHWEGDRIGFTFERLPEARDGESDEAYADRWRNAYLQSLRTFLGGDPRNLRLSGGIWRHIR